MSHSKLQSSYNIHRIKYSSQKNSLLASTNGKQFADRFIGDFIDVVSLIFEFLQFFVKNTKICHRHFVFVKFLLGHKKSVILKEKRADETSFCFDNIQYSNIFPE